MANRQYWLAELFHAGGNSTDQAWSGGDRINKVTCAHEFAEMYTCAQVCELLNMKWPLHGSQAGKYFRPTMHMDIFAAPAGGSDA